MNGFLVSGLGCERIQTKRVDGTKKIEVEVADFEKTDQLLEQLGFKREEFNSCIQEWLNVVECLRDQNTAGGERSEQATSLLTGGPPAVFDIPLLSGEQEVFL